MHKANAAAAAVGVGGDALASELVKYMELERRAVVEHRQGVYSAVAREVEQDIALLVVTAADSDHRVLYVV